MIDRRIKIRHLAAFIEIAQERRLKSAAEKLSLTQPAMSKTLKDLEDILGVTLLLRDRSGVELTQHGAVFLKSAKAVLANLRQGINDIEELKHPQIETLAIGALPSVAAWLMPAVLQELGNAEKRFNLRILDGPHDYLLQQLTMGKIDLVIGRFSDPKRMAEVSFTHLYFEHVDLIVRPGHPLLDAPRLEDVANFEVIFPPVGSAIRQSVDRFLMSQGIPPFANKIETVSGAFGRVYTQKSDAVWFISRGVVQNEVADGRLVRLPIDTTSTEGSVGMMTRINWEISNAAKLFWQALDRVVS